MGVGCAEVSHGLQNHTDIGCAGEAKNNSEIKIPNSSVVPPKTIFAFLMLNTMS